MRVKHRLQKIERKCRASERERQRRAELDRELPFVILQMDCATAGNQIEGDRIVGAGPLNGLLVAEALAFLQDRPAPGQFWERVKQLFAQKKQQALEHQKAADDEPGLNPAPAQDRDGVAVPPPETAP